MTAVRLVDFVQVPEVRTVLDREFPKPGINHSQQMKAEPMTKNSNVVGMAFDYLLRFRIERLNPDCHKQKWAAAMAVDELKNDRHPMYHQAAKMLSRAEESYVKYMRGGAVDNEVIQATLLLAQLEPYHRARRLGQELGLIDAADLSDLKNLLSITDLTLFRTHSVCMLDPTLDFDQMISADADLLIDETLIDIKTVREMKLTAYYWRQIVGYYLLWKVLGTVGTIRTTISKLGIYYSRHGQLCVFSVNDIESNPRLPELLTWFRAKAKWASEHPLAVYRKQDLY